MPLVKRGPRPKTPRKERDYIVVSFSVYREDDERLDRIVAATKPGGGITRNRSAIIRAALEHYERTVINPQPVENLCPTCSRSR